MAGKRRGRAGPQRFRAGPRMATPRGCYAEAAGPQRAPPVPSLLLAAHPRSPSCGCFSRSGLREAARALWRALPVSGMRTAPSRAGFGKAAAILGSKMGDFGGSVTCCEMPSLRKQPAAPHPAAHTSRTDLPSGPFPARAPFWYRKGQNARCPNHWHGPVPDSWRCC